MTRCILIPTLETVPSSCFQLNEKVQFIKIPSRYFFIFHLTKPLPKILILKNKSFSLKSSEKRCQKIFHTLISFNHLTQFSILTLTNKHHLCFIKVRNNNKASNFEKYFQHPKTLNTQLILSYLNFNKYLVV